MIITLDMGGTNIRIASWNEDKKIDFVYKIATNANDWKVNIDEIVCYIKSLNKHIEAIGIGMPGPANYKEGIFHNPPNLPAWHNLDLYSVLSDRLGLENIFFGNDAQLMALANHKYFNYGKDDISQFFTISTGLGAGLIMNDQIYTGAYGLAQEIAHLPVNSYDEINNYSPGALEYFASGGGLAMRAKKHLGITSTQELFDSYQTSEKAKLIIDQGIESLSNLIAITTSIVNPTSIIFDGSVTRNQKWYVDKAIEKAKAKMYKQQAENMKIHFAQLDDSSTLTGAYYLVESKLNKEHHA